MTVRALLCLVVAIAAIPLAGAQDEPAMSEAEAQAELAKKSQNPVANMISIPFEFWHDEGENGTGFSAVVKPVIPTPLGKMNLINRFILPYVSIDGLMVPPEPEIDNVVLDESGLANLTYQGFLSPTDPGKLIWGVGAAIELPTATNDNLGAERWAGGPSVLLLTMPGKWVLGLLAQNVWDFAGSGDDDVNRLTLQPIVSYTLNDGWYLTSAPVWTADWNAESDERWNVPLGAGVGKLQRFGKLPVDIKLVYYNYVEKPTLGADWSVLLGVKFILPQ